MKMALLDTYHYFALNSSICNSRLFSFLTAFSKRHMLYLFIVVFFFTDTNVMACWHLSFPKESVCQCSCFYGWIIGTVTFDYGQYWVLTKCYVLVVNSCPLLCCKHEQGFRWCEFITCAKYHSSKCAHWKYIL